MRLNPWTFLLLVTFVGGCDLEDKCIADCQADGTATGTDSTGEPTTSADSGSGGPSAECVEAVAAADQWVQDNRACSSILDCQQLDAICYQGTEIGTCGTVAVSVDADAAQWDALHGELESCGECGANACGSVVGCSDEGQCEDLGPGGDICPQLDGEIADFLANNRACVTDEDCVSVTSSCYDGPERACTEIALNTSADINRWAQLDELEGLCVAECGGSECGATVSCSPAGLCEATFP